MRTNNQYLRYVVNKQPRHETNRFSQSKIHEYLISGE